MKITEKITDETLQYNINRKTAKISALSLDKTDKNEYLTGDEIFPSDQIQIIKQAEFICSPLGKTFERQAKTIENQGWSSWDFTNVPTNKALLSIKRFILNKRLNPEALNELKRIGEQEQKVNRKQRLYKEYEKHDSIKFKTIQTFLNAAKSSIITMYMINDEQNQLAKKNQGT